MEHGFKICQKVDIHLFGDMKSISVKVVPMAEGQSVEF